MALSTRLTLSPSQSLVMTPQLQQAIKMLQFSQIELSNFVADEIERNPLLEFGPDQEPDSADATSSPEMPLRQPHQDRDRHRPSLSSSALSAIWPALGTNSGVGPRRDSPGQIGAGSIATSAQKATTDGGGSVRTDSDADIGATTAADVSLRDHIVGQINIDIADEQLRQLAYRLIDYLDEAGYLRTDMAELGAALDCQPAVLEALLLRLQTFDPTGLFSRSLEECLSVQLRELNRLDAPMEALLENLPMLADGQLDTLSTACAVSSDQLATMIDDLRSLNPRPASIFDRSFAQTVAPDLFLGRDHKGVWQVTLNANTLPLPVVNRAYYDEVVGQARNKEDRAYLSGQLQTANWLIKTLQQRATTILKVATEIVRIQQDYFNDGIIALRPLTLSQIAAAIEMHESTVSRAVNSKYIMTPAGAIELRYFFSNPVGNPDTGTTHSAAAIQHRIRLLIADEVAGKVLSDDKIVARLQADGIAVARRTVAKYRDLMQIPSSIQRRRRLARASGKK